MRNRTESRKIVILAHLAVWLMGWAVATAGPAVIELWPVPKAVQGSQLSYKLPDRATERLARGRTTELHAGRLADLKKLRRGDGVILPLFDGKMVSGLVELIQGEDDGLVRVAGKFDPKTPGTFSLTWDGDTLSGRILLDGDKIACVLETWKDGRIWLIERLRSSVICDPYPAPANARSARTSATASPSALIPPVLSSRPTAPAVLYLDFDGETVTDPDWNGGATIVAPAYPLTTAQITETWKRVKEDFLPFNVDVTTNVARYNSMAPGHRMRCIITSNDAASPGAGGVAYTDSFADSGGYFSTTIPCWVFNDTPVTIAEAVSHELGHTLGLLHDGRTSPSEEYYDGHGSGAVSWGPIMGASYYISLTQWSKGEYASADNHEDDLAIISGAANGFGYIADDAGNSHTAPAVLGRSGAVISQSGVISQTGDQDFYAFNTGACTFSVTATPASPAANLDIRLDLYNGSGVFLASANPDAATNATLTHALGGGVYFLRVYGTGRGNVLGDGYSTYGSLGAYTLGGSIPGSAQAPFVVSAGTASGMVTKAFSYRINATNSPTSYSVTGTLPPGLVLNTITGYITGTPTTAGTWTVSMRATNSIGTGSKTLVITISPAPPTLAAAVDATANVWTTGGNALWKVITGTAAYDAVDAAQSGIISNNQQSWLQTTVTGPGTISYRWKVSSEGGYDFLRFKVDGVEKAAISGEVAWQSKSFAIAAGTHTLQWVYTKDGSVADGSDAGWVDTVSIPQTSTRIISLSGSLAFGSVATGTTTGRNLTIKNTGTSALTVSSITYPTGFSGAWSGTIAAGASQVVTVKFVPTAAISYGGTVTVNANQTSGTNTCPVSGTGTTTQTRVIALSGDLAFGNVAVGSTATRVLKITNTGTAPLSITNISYPAGFSGAWAGTINSGLSYSITVFFKPTAAISYGGTITVNSNKTSGTSTIATSGKGL